MMKLAWTGYEKYAWGQNELKPIAKRSHSPSIFGSASNIGASIVDSLDTLFIMNLKDEYKKAKDWVLSSLDLKHVIFLFLYELNIRSTKTNCVLKIYFLLLK